MSSPIAERLYVHIGTPKTGTTSLQRVSGLNRARLRDEGILYPRTPGRFNHVRLALFASDGEKTRNLRPIAKLADEASYQSFRRGFLDELRAEIAASGCAVVYLSNEHLSSRVRRSEEITALATALRSIAMTVKIVVYLRPQHELYLSSYTSRLKAGSVERIRPPKNAADVYYNYDLMLAPWAEAFGEENILVRIFDRKRFPGGDVVRDFFALIGCKTDPDIERDEGVNRSLDAHALEFLRLFNRHVPFWADGKRNPERANIYAALAAVANGPKFTATKIELETINRLFAPSNAAVAARYLGRSDGVLFDATEVGDADPLSPLTVEKAVEIAAELWRWVQLRKRAMRAGSHESGDDIEPTD